MKVKRNTDVRQTAQKNGVCLWEIAEKYGMTDGNFSKLLRKELPPEKKARIFDIIDQLKKKEA